MTMEVDNPNPERSIIHPDRLDMTDANFPSSLPPPLRGFALQAFPPDQDDQDNQDGDNSTDRNESAIARLDHLEISLRSHLLQLVQDLLQCEQCQDNTNTNGASSASSFDEALDTLLLYVKDVTLLCLHVVHRVTTAATAVKEEVPKSYQTIMAVAPATFKKLPFLLLEDAFTSLPLTHIQLLWSGKNSSNKSSDNKSSPSTATATATVTTTTPLSISNYTPLLCHPHIFSPGSKFALLRICNTLLKQLSNRDVDSEFAGSIMMTLAKVFPISERSAVNVLGSFNVANVTSFEGREGFEDGWKLRHVNDSGDGDSGVGDNDGDGMQTEKSSAAADATLGYDFYSTFWGVQKVFTDPQGTILPSRGGLSHPLAFQGFHSFVADVRTILAALEGIPISSKNGEASTTALSTATATSTSSALSDIAGIRHHKYLTSSQLLHLQLYDSEIRIHFLTQLIIILSYLSSPSVTLPTATGETTTAAASTTTKTTKSATATTATKQLIELEKRTQQLLRQTPPSGESHWKTLQWILKERESIWKNWKKNKCMPAMDRVGDKAASERIRNLLSGLKRKALDSVDDAGGAATAAANVDNSNNAIQIKTELPNITAQMKQAIPTLDAFLGTYIEALDPESGIEETYHPRNDKVYCWRALRLLARDQSNEGQLRRFGKLRRRDGNFENVVRKIWSEEKGAEIPGEMAGEDEEDVEVEEEEEEEKDEEGENTTGEEKEDLEMEDPSVGSPVAEEDDGDDDGEVLDDVMDEEKAAAVAERKHEKMSEFQKAAMEVEEEMLNASPDPVGEKEEDAGGKEGDVAVLDTGEGKGPSTANTSPVAATKEDDKVTDVADVAKLNNGEKNGEKKEDNVTKVKTSDETPSGKDKLKGATDQPANTGKSDSSSAKSTPAENEKPKEENVPAAKTSDSKSATTSKGSAQASSEPQSKSQAGLKFEPPQKAQQQQQKEQSQPQKQSHGSASSSREEHSKDKSNATEANARGGGGTSSSTRGGGSGRGAFSSREDNSRDKSNTARSDGNWKPHAGRDAGRGGRAGGPDQRSSHAPRDNHLQSSGGRGRGEGDRRGLAVDHRRGPGPPSHQHREGNFGNRDGPHSPKDLETNDGGGAGDKGGGRARRSRSPDTKIVNDRGDRGNANNRGRGDYRSSHAGRGGRGGDRERPHSPKDHETNDGGGGAGDKGGGRGRRSRSPDTNGGNDRGDRGNASNRGRGDYRSSHAGRGGRGSGGGAGHNRSSGGKDDRSMRRGRR